jgi:hypothetical protein
MKEALALLETKGPVGSHRAWWAFEGFTYADCCLDTDRFALVVEGKRFERLAESVSWVEGRNQLARNLEVAATLARESGSRDYAVLMIGPTGTAGPSDAELTKGWPHLSPNEQDELLAHYLGATTWQRVCEATGLPYEDLPVTRDDVPGSYWAGQP